MGQRPIGLLSALPQEVTELLKKIENPKKIKSNGQLFISGQIAGKNVILTLSGMGKVNAAITAQRLVSEFNVTVLVFSGVAGGIHLSLKVGDVLIADKVFQYDVGFLSSKMKIHPPGILPEIGIGIAGGSYFYDLDVQKVSRALRPLEKCLQPVRVGKKLHQPEIKIGTIATGDLFIANPRKKRELAALGADAVEMEGAAVAQVARANRIPVLLIRAISDQAGSRSHVDFQSFLPVVAANNSILVVEAIRKFRA